ncbi:MAG: exo-alpha-sialidase [Opitutaceae bacterium]|nr:exo-alpha-sialidase [Opitutaceae bacterium]
MGFVLSASSAAAADAPVFWGRDLFIGGRGAYHTYRIPAMAVTARGTILAFCEGRRDSASDNGAIDTLLRRSTDGGRTWGPVLRVHGVDEGRITIGNPVPIVDRQTGEVHLLLCEDGKKLFYIKSADDGLSFTAPREITDVVNEQCRRIGFKWVHMLTGPGHGLQMRSGRLVVPLKPAGAPQDGVKRRTGVIYSDDHGRTWKPGGIVPHTIGELSESTVIERTDGKLMLNMRWHDGYFRATSLSGDGGLTWSEPKIEESLPDPVNQGSLLACSEVFGPEDRRVVFSNLDQGKITPEKGRTVIGSRARLTVRLSHDDGDTWDESCLIAPGFSGYSDLAMTRDGKVLLLYENGREIYSEKLTFACFDLAFLKEKGMTAPAAAIRAGLELAPLFRDHAVLQRGRPVPVWGRAAAGESVTVSFAGQKVSAKADAGGRWQVTLAPLAANKQGADLLITGETDSLAARDVLVGEVWLAAGQASMDLPVRDAANTADADAVFPKNPVIREIRIERKSKDKPDTTAGGKWLPAGPENTPAFGALGWFFANELYRRLDVPVGMIQCSWKLAVVEAWLSPESSDASLGPPFALLHGRWQKTLRDHPAALAKFTADMNAWKAAQAKAAAKGEAFDKPRPRRPSGPGQNTALNGVYNGMIHPLAPGALAGVILSLGESDAPRRDIPAAYQAAYGSALITGWRRAFGRDDLPVYWEQHGSPAGEGGFALRRAYFRESQARALALPATGQAVTIDLGPPKNSRAAVAARLARLALKNSYNHDLAAAGPAPAGAPRPEGAGFRVDFINCPGGLQSAAGAAVGGFELAGRDGRFRPAAAEIRGDSVLVTSPDIPRPAYIRYGWSLAGKATLRNRDGLPAAPFRTDNIPLDGKEAH